MKITEPNIRSFPMKKYHLIIIMMAISGLTFILLIFRPVPHKELKDCRRQEGIVIKIFVGGEKDIVFELKETKKQLYVYRQIKVNF